jgi:hypothetical protein
MQLILWLLKRCHVQNVPTLKAFRQMQADLRIVCELEPETVTSSLGNIFTVNDPGRSIQMVCAPSNDAWLDNDFFRTWQTPKSRRTSILITRLALGLCASFTTQHVFANATGMT